MYEMKIRVRYSEVDREGIARLHQILEYFQDCGTFQSEELGLGVEEDQKNHRAWYLIAWNVKIIRHPRMSEYIDVTTQAYNCLLYTSTGHGKPCGNERRPLRKAKYYSVTDSV